MADIDGGSGNDSLYGTAGDDKIKGEGGSDTIAGNGGDDDIDGGAGNYSISGGSGEDTIKRGDGHDSIQGDGGRDTIEGGEGDDTLKAGSDSDTFVYRDGHGSDTIESFDDEEDILAFDMVEISDYSDVLARMTEVSGDTIITFNNGETVTLLSVDNADLGPSNFVYSPGPVCLLQGTLICTERGDVRIEELRPDDIIWTKDRGWQALRLVTHETMVFRDRDDPAKPILIPAGALGNNRPSVDLITSPQHRILQSRPDSGEEVLVPAVKLVGQNGIRRMRGKKRAVYLNVVMERHSIIQAAGCWVESMLVTSRSMSRHNAAARRLIAQCRNMAPARRIERKSVRPRRLKIVG